MLDLAQANGNVEVPAGSDKDYWVLRLAQAVENAIEASTERSRLAHLELARHYWSMHVLINGRHRYADQESMPLLRRAA